MVGIDNPFKVETLIDKNIIPVRIKNVPEYNFSTAEKYLYQKVEMNEKLSTPKTARKS